MTRYLIFLFVLILVAVVPLSGHKANVRIGSKKFTESVILGELISQLWAAAGATPLHYQELGGTRVAFNALVDGQIDAYPEYTGTIEQEILAVDASRQEKLSLQEISRRLAAKGVGMSIRWDSTTPTPWQRHVKRQLD